MKRFGVVLGLVGMVCALALAVPTGQGRVADRVVAGMEALPAIGEAAEAGAKQEGRVLVAVSPADGKQATVARLASLKPGEVASAAEVEAAFGKSRVLNRPPLRIQKRRIRGNRIVVPRLGQALRLVRAPVRRGRMMVPGGVVSSGWLTTSAPLNARRGVSLISYHRDTLSAGRGRRSRSTGCQGCGVVRSSRRGGPGGRRAIGSRGSNWSVRMRFGQV